MAALQADDVGDLIKATLRDLGELKWTDNALPLQDYVAMRSLLKKERVVFDGGYGHQWQVMVDDLGTAKMTGLRERDDYTDRDVMIQATVPYRHATWNYSMDRREIKMNASSKRRVYDYIKSKRCAAMLSGAELLEDQFWGTPDSASTKDIYSINYYIVKNATTGFNGGAPSGFTTVANINPTTYTRWKNYTAEYVALSEDDLLTKWRRAVDSCKFVSPVEMPTYNRGDRWGFYTNMDVLSALQKLQRSQNENLGEDMDKFNGTVYFRRNPVRWVPKLDADAQDPIYGINWGEMYFAMLKDEYLLESDPHPVANQHTMTAVDIDLSLNLKCTNRRANFILNIA